MKQANSLIWGAWGGIACAVFALILEWIGDPLPGSVWAYGMSGFFWLWVTAEVRNWLGKRKLF